MIYKIENPSGTIQVTAKEKAGIVQIGDKSIQLNTKELYKLIGALHEVKKDIQ